MGKPFGGLFDVPYSKKTHNEITIDTSRLDYEQRRKTVERRLKRLLDSGRIKRVTREMIDFGRIVLYTYQQMFYKKFTKKEKNHADRFSELQKEES